MRLLLDTSVLLWWLDDDERLGPKARAAIADPENEVFVSSASAWEISVKRASGKLEAAIDIVSALERNYFTGLPSTSCTPSRPGSSRGTTRIRSTGCSWRRRDWRG